MLTVLLVFVVQLGSRFAFASRRSMSMRELIRSHQRVVMERAEWLECEFGYEDSSQAHFTYRRCGWRLFEVGSIWFKHSPA